MRIQSVNSVFNREKVEKAKVDEKMKRLFDLKDSSKI